MESKTMTTLHELATEYPDQSGEIEAHELPGLEEYCAGASVFLDDEGETCTVYLFIQEPLEFHGNYVGAPLFERTDDDCEWQLSEAVFQALPAIISERYDGENFDMAGDAISFDIPLTLPASTNVEDVAGLFWERSKVVQFINEADPGTFGSQYLFGSIIAEAMMDDA
jgi:hypothetical protein